MSSLKKTAVSLAITLIPAICSAADAPAKPVIAKVCTNCHKAEAGTLRGLFDNVSLKSKAIQIRMDDNVEVVNFDEKSFQVVNDARKTGNIDLMKNNAIKKGHEIKIEFTDASGVKTATKLTVKPPVELPAAMLISTDEVAKLVAKGSGYYLFDSRPAIRFQDGAIPTAVNLPFPAFDKMAEKLLPADKNALVIFYCAGVSCNMSPASADKAKKLGYTNIKVYKDGMPAWSAKNYAVLTPQILKEAWLDKGTSLVLLDLRPEQESAKGAIKGAVTFPAKSSDKLIKKLTLKQKKAPIILYDTASGTEAAKIAARLIKVGYTNIKMLTGGFDAWKASGYEVTTGALATKISYAPKPRQGEIDIEEFRKFAAAPPADVIIVDVRTVAETALGMLKTAINLPLPDLREKAAELPKDKLVVLQCNTGNQAEMAYHLLKELGFTKIKFLNAQMTFTKNGKYELTKEL
ncbi:MAG: sulfurtransferase [Geobacteraceae bacterium]|nr:sulfurtransferase [Geobacteraceae bacterium]